MVERHSSLYASLVEDMIVTISRLRTYSLSRNSWLRPSAGQLRSPRGPGRLCGALAAPAAPAPPPEEGVRRRVGERSAVMNKAARLAEGAPTPAPQRGHLPGWYA